MQFFEHVVGIGPEVRRVGRERLTTHKQPEGRYTKLGAVAGVVSAVIAVLTWVGSLRTESPGANVGSSSAVTTTASVTPTPSLHAPPLPSGTGSGESPAVPAAGDLGLEKPLTTVPCNGSYAVFVGAAVMPGNYDDEVQTYLDRYPGSAYLLAEQNCTSLRHHMDNGASIYTVYYGPYPTLTEACNARSRVGGDSFIRRLDNSTPVGQEPRC